MIIQILANLQEEGYLTKARHPTAAPFFAGANVAFRREALQEIGGYDPGCRTGEDCDVCARLTAADWELYLRPEAIVTHDNPSTLGHLVRQWFGYGLYHPYVFAKHNERAVEVHARLGRPVSGERYACVFYRRFPLAVVVFITRFLVMHLLALATTVVWLAGWATPGWIGIALTAASLLLYACPDLKRSSLLEGVAFSVIRYAADAALFVGALLGGLRQNMIYVSATVD
jgi:cellulose synthase/poly-beta-1,6-N-acetylglucosamine synthase-like glycosyltransferase